MTAIYPIARRPSVRARKGTAVAELAICLPMLMIFVLGTVEATDAVFLRHRLTTAAYEAARKATAPGQTAATAITAGTAILTSRSVHNGSVSVAPVVTANTTTGTDVSATARAPFSKNCCITPFVFAGWTGDVTVTVSMVRQ
jgi:Flp pilus assembly protein TadG